MINNINGLNNFTPYNRLQSELHSRSLFTKNLSELGQRTVSSFQSQSAQEGRITPFAAPGTTAADFEEMTFMLSAEMEKKMKAINSRNFAGQTTTARRVESIEKLRKMYELLDSEHDQRSLQFRAKKIVEFASEERDFPFSDDSIPAGNYIVLNEAAELAKSQGNEAALHHIEKQIDTLQTQDGAKVDAGLNTAEVLHGAFESNNEREAMRAIYYQSILGAASVSTLMTSLLNSFGDRDFSKSIQTLTKAVMQDIRSARPSTAPEQLEAKLKDLNSVNYCRSIVNDSKQFLQNFLKKKDVSDQQSVALTREILTFTRGSIFANDLDTFAVRYAGSDADHKIVFLNAIFPFIKSLPEVLWENQKNRMTGLQTILIHMENEATRLHRV